MRICLFSAIVLYAHGTINEQKLQDKNKTFFLRMEAEVLEMSEQAREAQREYNREWARKNPEKVKAKNQKYWERRAARLAKERGGAKDGATEET